MSVASARPLAPGLCHRASVAPCGLACPPRLGFGPFPPPLPPSPRSLSRGCRHPEVSHAAPGPGPAWPCWRGALSRGAAGACPELAGMRCFHQGHQLYPARGTLPQEHNRRREGVLYKKKKKKKPFSWPAISRVPFVTTAEMCLSKRLLPSPPLFLPVLPCSEVTIRRLWAPCDVRDSAL